MSRGVALSSILFCAGLLRAQGDSPIFLTRANLVLPPAMDATGQTAVFGSIIPPGSSDRAGMDIYLARIDTKALRRLTQLPVNSSFPIGASAVTESADGSKVGYIATIQDSSGSHEEVHVVNTVSLDDRKVGVDTVGCIQPLALCIGCFVACLHTPHLSPDGTKLLYSSSRFQPFFMANSDGTGQAPLPVYSGSLAPAAQRVISNTGLIVFTSSAPFGPTFVAAPMDVYVMNLDGNDIRLVTHFTNSMVYARDAIISADGTVVVFQSNLNQNPLSQGANLFIARTDGSSIRQLTFDSMGVTSFSLSSDGTRLVYTQAGQAYLLYTDARQPVAKLTSLRQSSVSDVVIGNDGSRVLFTVGPSTFGRAAIGSIAADRSNFQLVYAPRSINPNGIVGIAGNTAPSPGSFFSIYGTNLAADDLQVANGLPIPQSLAGISVIVNGQAVPVQAVTPWQVNAQLPQQTAAGAAMFQLQFAAGIPVTGMSEVKSSAPAIFSYPVTGPSNISGYNQAAVFHTGTSIPVDMTHPAAAGETLEMYGTGLGITLPPVDAGTASPSQPVATVVARPEVFIGGTSQAEVTFAGLTPGFVGLYQVNAVVPAGLKSGVQSIVWTTGDNRGGTGSIWVK